MTYLILSFATILVLVFLAVQDLKERMIFSFPVLFLSVVWAAYSVLFYKDNPIFLITAWSTAMTLYMAYRIGGVWGDGDSDLWLLFTGITLCTFDFKNMLQFGFLVCILLVAVQGGALIAGLIEASIKKRKLNRHSDIAVVPGFAFVLIAVIIYGIYREVSFV